MAENNLAIFYVRHEELKRFLGGRYFTRNQNFADALEAAMYLEPETDETKPDYSPVDAIFKY